jgi:hypothetical protein
MSGGQLIIGVFGMVVLLTVLWLVTLQLRGRRFRWLLVPLATLFYLSIGNLYSWLLIGVIYPVNPAATGLPPILLLVIQMIHSVISLGGAFITTIVAVAALRHVLPRTAPKPPQK